MPRVRFTARLIDSIKAPAADRVEYWDDAEPGFGLRVSDHGRKTWVVMYRHQGRLRRLTLGTYPAISLASAREKANDALRAAAAGEDPAGEKRALAKAETFGEVAEQYIRDYAKPHKRSWKEDRRALDRDLLPRFKTRKAVSINRAEVRALLRDIKGRGAPILANRTLEILRRIYRWANEEEILDCNPCAGMQPPSEKRRRERVLSDDEIRAVWQALDKLSPRVAARFRLQILTAQRPGEVMRMRRADVTPLDGKWWTLPGDLTKNGRAHRVPLVDAAVEVLKTLGADDTRRTWVFESPSKDQAVRGNTKAMERLRRFSGVDFTPHDLRRTVATNLGGLGFSRFIIGRVLNHVDPSVTGVYDLYEYDREKRAALEAWASHLTEILSRSPAGERKVVPLRAAKG